MTSILDSPNYHTLELKRCRYYQLRLPSWLDTARRKTPGWILLDAKSADRVEDIKPGWILPDAKSADRVENMEPGRILLDAKPADPVQKIEPGRILLDAKSAETLEVAIERLQIYHNRSLNIIKDALIAKSVLLPASNERAVESYCTPHTL